ncbi:MAG: hypothetical protein P1V97_27220 [Planctomycetota bacterium]|nr:hypothetical protein [Planctomycetota bacterium]
MAKRIKLDPERLAQIKEILNRKNPKPYKTSTQMTFFRGLIEDALAVLDEDQGTALELLKRAAKGSKRREDRRDSVLLELGDLEHPVLAMGADRELSHLLVTAEEKRRDILFQRLAYHPSRIRFRREIHSVAADPNDPSWWAAQAISQLLDWPFEWHGDNVPGVKERAYKHFGEDWIQSRLDAFDKGLMDLE